ncbi:MAG: MopE-related protein [Myxococcota bacterium]
MTKQVRIFAILGLTGLLGVACNGDSGPTDTSDTDNPDATAGNAVVDPCNIDFGTLQGGETAGRTFAVNNTGLGPLEILSVTVTEPFTTAAAAVGVDAGASYKTTVRFEPATDDFGLFNGEMIVTTNDPDEPSIVCSLSGSVTDDADQDGFVTAEAGGDDCDDADPEINPGATEIWYDNIDQDCAGDSDFDQDGDGYDTLTVWTDSTTLNPETGLPGGDCQDADATINPGETEVWYDGKDADCDGQNDFDRDGDGYRTAEFGYDDCDDDDALANPEAIEAFNGADDDCNGLVDDNASPERADRIGYGDDDDYGVGRGIGLADIDKSGTPDMLIGCHLYQSSGSSTTSGSGPGGLAIFWDNGMADQDFICGGDEDVFIEAEDATDELGFELITLDFFPDSTDDPDFAVTARAYDRFAGKVYVFEGSSVGTSTVVTDAKLQITGLSGYQLGGGLGTGDLNGDGAEDLIMYSSAHTALFTRVGLHYGGTNVIGSIDWTDLDATYYQQCGEDPRSTYYLRTCGNEIPASTPGGDAGGSDQFMQNGHAAADFDGDGYDDAIFGDPLTDANNADQAGGAWLLFGRRSKHGSSNIKYDDALTIVGKGSTKNAEFGGAVTAMPDIDGDGDDELLVHDDDRSRLYLIEGSPDAKFGFDDVEESAIAVFTGVSQFTGVTNAGDWDGDGVDDLAIGFGQDGTAGKGGSLYMITSSEWAGERTFATAAYGSIIGDVNNVRFGLGAPIVSADLDGNGTSDLVVGDYGYDDQELTDEGAEGAVFVFYNTNL